MRYNYCGDVLYLYDESGIIGAIQKYNSTTETFYFDRNIKGDVIGIYNASGTQIAKYSYDAWGKCTPKTLVSNSFSSYNPIRYRGYYYDRETTLYYLNARYYDPSWRRFISPDHVSSLNPSTANGLNLYSYADNNPINIQYYNTETIVVQHAGMSNFSLNAEKAPHNKRMLPEGFAEDTFILSGPRYFNNTRDRYEIIGLGFTLYRLDYYYNRSQEESIYSTFMNFDLFAGYNKKEKRLGIFAYINVQTIGFNGKYIDAAITVGGTGLIIGLEDFKLRLLVDPPGTIGFDMSIDLKKIYNDFFDWRNGKWQMHIIYCLELY